MNFIMDPGYIYSLLLYKDCAIDEPKGVEEAKRKIN
jgi:hypothetical protein